MKKLTTVAALLISTFTTSYTFADTTDNANLSPDYTYVRGALGGVHNNYSQSLTPSFANVSDESDHTAASLSVGYIHQLQMDPRFSVGGEVASNYLGSDKLRSGGQLVTIENSSLDFSGVGLWHLNQKFDVIGKAGMSYQIVDASNDALETEGRNTDWVPMLGAGIGYNFQENWVADITITHYFGKNEVDSTGEITSYMAGVSYKF